MVAKRTLRDLNSKVELYTHNSCCDMREHSQILPVPYVLYSDGISGTLRTSSGVPLAGVTMRLSGPLEAVSTTDSYGFYNFTFLPSGDFSVAPQESTGYQPQSRSVTFTGEAMTADFVRPDSDANGYAIAGQVQGLNGQGVVGLVVQLFAGGEFVAEFLSDESGGFSVTGLDAGVYTFRLADQDMALNDADVEVTVPAESKVLLLANIGQLATGFLQIHIQPQEAADAGAQWRRVGTTTWYASGELETDVPVGEYEIEFKSVPAWQPDGTIEVQVQEGKTATGMTSYIEHKAALFGVMMLLLDE
ncbi:MAG: carboxypeptidase-like regulatory domain-containing protein [Desulfovermiculus sp.]|nr:carboxypeptidase-like regulatory domain-containing protein [Desulfovermiculus sp.]